MNRSIVFLFSIILLVALFLLATGSELLVVPFLGLEHVPWGTPITWAGLVSLSGLVYQAVPALRKPENRFVNVLSILLKITLVLAILWGFVCFGLAGNWSYSFSEKATFQGGQTAMMLFWYFSGALAVLPILVLLLHGLGRLIRRMVAP
jgi:hypothetical protein